MRKLIAAINTTLDGVCDHTAGLPDEEIHQHYTELLGQGDAILYRLDPLQGWGKGDHPNPPGFTGG